MEFGGINFAYQLRVLAADNAFRRKARGMSPNYVVIMKD